jgi:hypothetical protein
MDTECSNRISKVSSVDFAPPWSFPQDWVSHGFSTGELSTFLPRRWWERTVGEDMLPFWLPCRFAPARSSCSESRCFDVSSSEPNSSSNSFFGWDGRCFLKFSSWEWPNFRRPVSTSESDGRFPFRNYLRAHVVEVYLFLYRFGAFAYCLHFS